MKKTGLLGMGMALIFLLTGSQLSAQGLFDKIQRNVERKVERRVEQKVDRGVDNSLDKVEGKNSGKNKNSSSSSSSSGKNSSSSNSGSSKNSSGSSGKSSSSSSSGQSEEMKAWSKYDFVPGDDLIFADDLDGEQNGEFPSRWDLKAGSAEIAMFGKENVINFKGNPTEITPLMNSNSYLPESFTLEFDAYFYNLKDEGYTLKLDGMDPIKIHLNYAEMDRFSGITSESKENPSWRHVALSYNTRALKLYLDHDRVLNIPNVVGAPYFFSIEGLSPLALKGETAMIKNIRVAEGGVKLYYRLRADGKIVTRGITFDRGSSNLKPESFGTLNDIYKMLEEHPDINLSIEGHTDRDGDEASNQALSEKRAEVVKEALVSMGIASSRLETKGFGESKPVDTGNGPEAKQNNRRVEFVQF